MSGIRPLSAAVASVLIAVGVAGVQLAVSTTAAATTSATPSSDNPAVASAAAVAQAKSTGKPVDIPTLTTPTETVAADPSGTLTLTESVYPTRVKRDNAWVPVNPALHVAADGSLAPAAVPSGITLSNGGDTQLATLTSHGKRLTVSWPDALPKPTVSGNTATYAEVFPGVDLRASVSPLGGFSEVLVVKNATAAADPQLDSIKLNTKTVGLAIQGDSAGNLNATDSSGASVFTSPTAIMWDSSTPTTQTAARSATVQTEETAPAGTAAPTPSSAAGPGTGAQTASIPAQVSAGQLTLTPDASVLLGADTHYPVYIDPSWNPNYASDPKQSYDEIQQGCPGTNHLNSTTAPYDTPGVGQNAYSGCIGIEEAYFQFKTDTRLWGSSVKITNATFKATEVYAANLDCSYTSNVQVKLSSAIDTSTTWNNRPSLSTLEDTQPFGSTCTTNPSQGFDVTDAFSRAAAGKWGAVALGMVASDESKALDFRRFANNPTVTVQYDSVPLVSSVSTSPSSKCTGGTTIGHTSTTLDAYITDADGGAPLQAKFSLLGKDASGKIVYPAGGTAAKTYEPATTVTAHGTVSWPVGYLPSGNYTWTAQADDGKYLSSTKTCSFAVDATAPGQPTITSPVFDNGGTAPEHSSAEFDFTPPVDAAGNSVTDIDHYAYNWGTPPATVDPVLTVPAAANGAVTKVTLKTGGYLHNVLWAYSVDKAGNQSTAVHYDFDTEPPTTADPTGDFSGDGNPDLVVPGPNGNVRLYQGDGQGGLNAPLDISKGGGFSGAKLAVGGFQGWGEQDILAITSNGQAHIYYGNGDAEPMPSFAPTDDDVPAIAPQDAILSSDTTFTWAQVTQIAAADDAQGDQPNLWAVTSDGTLWWIPATQATGDFDTPVQLATGWQNKNLAYGGMIDGIPALWARNTSTGELDLYTGGDNIVAGSDTSTKTVAAATGWTTTAHPQIFSAGVNATGTPNLWSTDNQAVRNLLYYPGGSTAGSLGTGARVQTLEPSDDFTGDGQADIVAEWNDGTLHMYSGEGGGKLTGAGKIWDSSWNTMKLMVSGDFNGDGTADVMAIWGDGTLHLYTGAGNGTLNAASSPISSTGNSWGTVKQLVSGDFNGDGKTDLSAVWNDGTLHLYLGDGQGGLQTATSMWSDSSWGTMKLLAAGDYTGDGNADILGIWNDGTLHLYPGDGKGKVVAGSQMYGGTTWATVKHLIPGDFSGDGKTDLAAVWGDGTLHLYTGDGKGTLAAGVSMWDDASWATTKLTA
jgi:FG-GAP-like repeat